MSRWPVGTRPQSAAGLAVDAFADGLDHPRWVYVLPNGDVLVAETNAPERPDDAINGWFFKRFQKKAGGAVPSADRITLLRDTNRDGAADRRFAFLSQQHSPFGMVLVNGALIVANTDALVQFPYHDGDTTIATPGRVVTPRPRGASRGSRHIPALNRHWSRQ